MALVGGILLAPSPVLASAHFIKGPTGSVDSKTGDYTVTFKEAGLGNNPVTYIISAGTEDFTFQCFTKNGNTPQGAPNGISFSNDSSQTTLTPRNGQITGSLSLIPDQGSASCQGKGLHLCLTAVDYEDVTFTDVTDGVVANLGSARQSGLMICDF
jgi:hypothetical protein